MKLAFVFDVCFKKFKGDFYSINLSYEFLRNRYLPFFDEIIVVGRYSNINFEQASRMVKMNGESVSVKCLQNKSSISRVFKISEERKFIEEAIKDCDAVILRSWWGRKVCNQLNKPYLIEVVNCAWDAFWNHSYLGKMAAFPNMIMQKKAIYNAQYVLYVTNEFLQKRYPTKGKQLGCSDVCLEKINPEILANRIEHIKKNGGKYIIGTTAAVDVKYKGQEFVIKALSILKKRGITNFEYQLVGNGSQERLKQIAKKYGVEDRVVFLGGKPHDKVFEWLDSIDIYIQPSLTEGLPRALIEAQSRALPCCGTLVGGIPELLLKECVFDKKGDLSLTIANWLQDFTDEKAIEYATWNFNNSKNYQSDILAAKRDAFYREFIEYVERGKE